MRRSDLQKLAKTGVASLVLTGAHFAPNVQAASNSALKTRKTLTGSYVAEERKDIHRIEITGAACGTSEDVFNASIVTTHSWWTTTDEANSAMFLEANPEMKDFLQQASKPLEQAFGRPTRGNLVVRRDRESNELEAVMFIDYTTTRTEALKNLASFKNNWLYNQDSPAFFSVFFYLANEQ